MIVFKAHDRGRTSAAFSPDGNLLATASVDDVVRLWPCTDKPKMIREWPGSWGIHLAFSPDGKYLAPGGYVRVWEVMGADEPVLQLSGEAADTVAFSPTGKEFAVWTHAGLLRWEVPSWKPLPSLSTAANYTGGLAYSPDGGLVASCFAVADTPGIGSVIRIWDTTTGTERCYLYSAFRLAHATVVRFSPDGRLLAVIYGPTLRIWDVAERREIATRRTGSRHLTGLTFTTDGQRLATVSNDATVRLWSAPRWTESGGFEWKIGKLVSIDASRDGCRMAAGSGTGQVVVWDVD
jgi:WD40 repeat protein